MPSRGGRIRANLIYGYRRIRGGDSVVLFVEVPKEKVHLVNNIVFKVRGKSLKHRCCAKPNGRNYWMKFVALFHIKNNAAARITIVGCGGAASRLYLKISSSPDAKLRRKVSFTSQRSRIPLGPVATPGSATFGIELEMSSASHETASEVAAAISSRSNVAVVNMQDDYRSAKNSHQVWVLMHDGSLACHRDRPDCNLWELKSRILSGEDGIAECERVVEAARSQASVRVNKSMGFHIHVDRSGLSLFQTRNVCLMFVEFERTMDSFMPKSRRRDNNEYGASNRGVVGGIHATFSERREILLGCLTIEALVDAMNPMEHPGGGRGGRYFKLNLRTGDKGTFEFRQHSATASGEKVKCFLHFCLAFVRNSADVQDLPEDQGDEFEQLFKHIIKDRYLRDYYLKRRLELSDDVEVIDDDSAQNIQCRLPATLSPEERIRFGSISLNNRSGYFSLSTYPITSERERLMEGVSKAVSNESYGSLWDVGVYHCAQCNNPLYSSADKWRAQCIWPTFRAPIGIGSLKTVTIPDGSYNGYCCEVRELYCGTCDLFLGHQFLDGRESGDSHPEAKWRHCTLSLSLEFVSSRSVLVL